jgi:hypothetical protein
MAILRSGTVVLPKPHLGCPTASDIAYQSALVRRYGGAIDAPLLPHLWMTAMLAWVRSNCHVGVASLALLHDAHEVVTGEVVVPFKPEAMRGEQEWLDYKIFGRFLGVTGYGDWAEFVKECDVHAGDLEAVYFGLPGYAEQLAAEGRELYVNDPASRLVIYLYSVYPVDQWVGWTEDVLTLMEARAWPAVADVFSAVVTTFGDWNARFLGTFGDWREAK